jgi:hypothetical protein
MLTGFASPLTYSKPTRQIDASPSSAINRLLAAAVVNKTFRDLLLGDPVQALTQGYGGESFSLTAKERNLVLSIQADNLRDFSLQILSSQEGRLQNRSAAWIPAGQNALVYEP